MANFPAIVLNSLIYIETIFLNLMEYVKVPMTCWMIGGVCHFTICYYFVFIKGLNIKGIGYACSITNFIIYTLMLTYSRCFPDIQSAIADWTDSRIIHFNGVVQYFLLGIPSCMTMCLEWWSFEIAVLVAGYIGPVD
jgi:multidrug resistance protein, MATE family